MQTLAATTSILALALGAFTMGCSSDENAQGAAGTRAVTMGSGGSGTSTTSGDTTSSTTTGGGSSSTTTGTGGTGGGNDTPAPLPFVVDSAFVASGFMGDGSKAGAIVQDDNGMCAATRPAGAQGHCHKFTYTPQAGGEGWGGVYWQYPVNNWGDQAGKRIAPGATTVKFSAAGGAGGEVVTFLVGGMMGHAFQDTLTIKVPETLGTTSMDYSMDLTGQTYDAVLGGFGWTIEAPAGSTTPIVFTVDNIRWE